MVEDTKEFSPRRIVAESVIEGYTTELTLELYQEKDCRPELWERMGKAPFYEVRLWDGFLKTHLTTYVKQDQLLSLWPERR